jgi:hypothetical protein
MIGCPSTAPVPATQNSSAGKLGPRLEIKETKRDVGEADFSVPCECKFPLRNVGGEPLTLSLVSKSCQCVDATAPGEIAPGQEATIVVRWTPIPGQVGAHRAAWEFETNDPAKPTLRLEVTGTVAPLVHVAPENVSYIDFDRLEPGAKRQFTLTIYSTKLPGFDLDAKVTSPGIKVTKSKLEPDDVRISLDAKPTAAYSVVLETTPQLPPGSSISDLIMKIKAPNGNERTITLRTYAVVANGLFKVMPDEVGFKKPRLADGDKQKVRVQFFDPAKQRSLKIVKSEPAFLQCDPPRALPGAPGQWEFVVRIPPKNADAARVQPDQFFEGVIVLGASDSDVQIPVRVKWIPELPVEKH